MEMAIEAEDVGMTKINVDLDFSADLLLDLPLLQLTLVEDFQGANEACGPLFRKVYSAEFALSKRLADLKHAKMKLLWLRLLDDRRV